MALQLASVEKPFRKLRKILKNFPGLPVPEDVHSLRTQTRRIEAIIRAFQLDQKACGINLLKGLKPIRAAAGGVRDMDVLLGLVSSLEHNAKDQHVQLLEFLAACRFKAAAKLQKTIAARSQKARKHIKRCSNLIQDRLASLAHGRHPMARSLELETELAEWPGFTPKNLHPYRLKVKELRYVLQLAHPGDTDFTRALAEVKNQVGAWHDWIELASIANKAFKRGSARELIQPIRFRANEEFDKALDSANALRARYPSGKSTPGKKGPALVPSPTVIAETSRLAS